MPVPSLNAGLLIFNPVNSDYPIGAYYRTIGAPSAGFRIFHIGIMVSFPVHLLGHSNGIRGAVYQTDLATFATFHIHYNGTSCFCHAMLF
jgi:hypothetical protein